MLGAFAFGDVRNRTLVSHHPIRCVPHGSRVLEYDELLPVSTAHEKLSIPDLPFRLHTVHEFSTIRGVPVELHNAWQCVEFLS